MLMKMSLFEPFVKFLFFVVDHLNKKNLDSKQKKQFGDHCVDF